ncbi:MAG: DUF4112 domain-containing protein [Candidatus Limnocylindrales bacterium]
MRGDRPGLRQLLPLPRSGRASCGRSGGPRRSRRARPLNARRQLAGPPRRDHQALHSPSPDGQALDRERQRLRRLAWLLDQSLTVPGTHFRIGLESLVGVIPLVGDVTGGVIGAYLIIRAWQYGLPRVVIARMMANTAFDLVSGVVPILGDLVDFVYRSNVRNIELFERYVAEPGRSTRGEWAFFGVLLGVLLVAIVLAVALLGWTISLIFSL